MRDHTLPDTESVSRTPTYLTWHPAAATFRPLHGGACPRSRIALGHAALVAGPPQSTYSAYVKRFNFSFRSQPQLPASDVLRCLFLEQNFILVIHVLYTVLVHGFFPSSYKLYTIIRDASMQKAKQDTWWTLSKEALLFCCSLLQPFFLTRAIRFEIVTTHLSVTAVPVQTRDAPSRKLLAWIKVLAPRLVLKLALLILVPRVGPVNPSPTVLAAAATLGRRAVRF